MKKIQEKYLSTTETASLLGISRVAVFKKIQNGKIKAEKVGRNYIVHKNELKGVLDKKNK